MDGAWHAGGFVAKAAAAGGAAGGGDARLILQILVFELQKVEYSRAAVRLTPREEEPKNPHARSRTRELS